ncbi:hypothetical protein JOD54_005885 [Actinokineospora baliensis]|nr:hypothetical protein [Actinokineospora baliensis]
MIFVGRLACGIGSDPRFNCQLDVVDLFCVGPLRRPWQDRKAGAEKRGPVRAETLRTPLPHTKQVHHIEQLAPATSECPVVASWPRGRVVELAPELRVSSGRQCRRSRVVVLAPAASECPVVASGVGVGRLGWHQRLRVPSSRVRWSGSGDWAGTWAPSVQWSAMPSESGGCFGWAGSVGWFGTLASEERWSTRWAGSVGWAGTPASGSGGRAGSARWAAWVGWLGGLGWQPHPQQNL